jgi:hypothetical protein
MCILLGAVSPDHHLDRLVPSDYMRMTATQQNRQILKEIHGR